MQIPDYVVLSMQSVLISGLVSHIMKPSLSLGGCRNIAGGKQGPRHRVRATPQPSHGIAWPPAEYRRAGAPEGFQCAGARLADGHVARVFPADPFFFSETVK